MVLNKITVGYVVQQYDTEKKRFINQEFKGSDEETWEDLDGNPVEEPENAGTMDMEMVQPPAETPTPIVPVPPAAPPPLIASPLSFYVGEDSRSNAP